jgi:large subunit ribosomal protein L24
MHCKTEKKAKLKIKSGDMVIAITGKDKGKRGKVIKVVTKTMRVLVEGINVAKKHVKPSQAFPQGGIVAVERPIHYSNVAIVDPKADMPTKIGYKMLADGKKVRYARRSGEIIDNKAEK